MHSCKRNYVLLHVEYESVSFLRKRTSTLTALAFYGRSGWCHFSAEWILFTIMLNWLLAFLCNCDLSKEEATLCVLHLSDWVHTVVLLKCIHNLFIITADFTRWCLSLHHALLSRIVHRGVFTSLKVDKIKIHTKMVIFEMRGCDILKEVKFAPLQVIPLKWLLYIFSLFFFSS